MVSTTEGSYPRWSGDGKQLIFIGMSNAFMVADVQPGVTFQSGTPRRLFGDVPNFPFGSTLAGDRFLFMDFTISNTPGPPPPFTVVLNWYTRLKNETN
jgi:hypothetical protein